MFHVEFSTPIGNTARQFILSESPSTASANLLLMVQKSGDHQLRLVVYPHDVQGFIYIQTVLGIKISEPSTSILVHFKVKLASFRQKARTSGAPMGFIFPPQKKSIHALPTQTWAHKFLEQIHGRDFSLNGS